MITRVPSKTFFLGEYLVLEGGPCLVATTHPAFEISSSEESLHPNSPAGVWGRKHGVDTRLKVSQPHPRAGGFGSSTAEFLAVYSRGPQQISPWEMLHDYRDCLEHTASGADLLAQYSGGLVFFEENTKTLNTLSWSFENLEFSLFQMPQKLKTHDHLKDLQSISTTGWNETVHKGIEYLLAADAHGFVDSVREYGERLQGAGLVDEKTREVLQTIDSQVLAAKGCGAMGADVVFCLHERGQGIDCELPLVAQSCDIFQYERVAEAVMP